jgi:F0F1-type ATP synthase assembly protein I
MDDICILTQKINKLESDHKDYVEFGAGCFLGIFVTGTMIDHYHDPYLWLVLLALTGSLVAAIVIGVKKALEKDRYIAELKVLTSNLSAS